MLIGKKWCKLLRLMTGFTIDNMAEEIFVPNTCIAGPVASDYWRGVKAHMQHSLFCNPRCLNYFKFKRFHSPQLASLDCRLSLRKAPLSGRIVSSMTSRGELAQRIQWNTRQGFDLMWIRNESVTIDFLLTKHCVKVVVVLFVYYMNKYESLWTYACCPAEAVATRSQQHEGSYGDLLLVGGYQPSDRSLDWKNPSWEGLRDVCQWVT